MNKNEQDSLKARTIDHNPIPTVLTFGAALSPEEFDAFKKLIVESYGPHTFFIPINRCTLKSVSVDSEKSGVDLIAEERQEQIVKYGFTGEHHANHPEWYEKGQLLEAASLLCSDTWGCMDVEEIGDEQCPHNWDKEWWKRLVRKTHYERMIIAGALIAAEIDRRIYDVRGGINNNTPTIPQFPVDRIEKGEI